MKHFGILAVVVLWPYAFVYFFSLNMIFVGKSFINNGMCTQTIHIVE